MSYTFDGDATEAANWYPVALTEQQSMIRLGIHSKSYSPINGVDIIIRTKPPHIHIKAGGVQVFISDGISKVWPVLDNGSLGKVEEYVNLPNYAKVGRGIWGKKGLGIRDYVNSITKERTGDTAITPEDLNPEHTTIAYELMSGTWTQINVSNGVMKRNGNSYVTWDVNDAVWNKVKYTSPNDVWILAARVFKSKLLVLEANELKLVNGGGNVITSCLLPDLTSNNSEALANLSDVLKDQWSTTKGLMMGSSRARFLPSSDELIVYNYIQNTITLKDMPWAYRIGFKIIDGVISANLIDKYYVNIDSDLLEREYPHPDTIAFQELYGILSNNEIEAFEFRYAAIGVSGRINWR